jgi:hypothetical protein
MRVVPPSVIAAEVASVTRVAFALFRFAARSIVSVPAVAVVVMNPRAVTRIRRPGCQPNGAAAIEATAAPFATFDTVGESVAVVAVLSTAPAPDACGPPVRQLTHSWLAIAAYLSW